MNHWKHRSWLIVTIGIFAALGAATSAPEDDGGSESEADQQAQAWLDALEQHLESGSTYGEGPDGEMIARAARGALAEGDGVAVRVVPGSPRNITVLVRYRSEGGFADLREIPSDERREELDRILDAIDETYEAGGDRIALGIRGTAFFGAIVTRVPGEAADYHVGSVVSTDVMRPFLAATPGEDAVTTLTLREGVQGQLQPHPVAQPTYRVHLDEPKALRVQLYTTELREAHQPFAIVCRGPSRAYDCQEIDTSDADFPDALYDQQDTLLREARAQGQHYEEDVYSLAAGDYTIVVVRNECEVSPCPSDNAPFTLRVL